MSDTNSIAIFTRASQMLAEADTIQKTKELKNLALTAADWARRKGMGAEAVRYAQSYAFEAERKMGEMLAATERAKRPPGPGRGKVGDSALPTLSSSPPTLKELGLTKKESSTAQKLASLPREVFDEIRTGEKTLTEVLKDDKESKRREYIQKQRYEIESGAARLPTGLFEVIAVDPPWPYGTEYDSEGRRAANPYPEMSLEQIQAIPLLSADDCVLWLWTTHKFMRHSFAILDSWGFRDVMIVTWVKDRMGLGTWLRSQSEFCIMAVKGKPLIELTNQTTVIHGKLREHSRKPDEFYDLVNGLCIGRKLDYFSREERTGWEQYGNEKAKF